MDASDVFRHVEVLGTFHRHQQPRLPQGFHPTPPTRVPPPQDKHAEGNSHRIAHTLTACCRCRQRKTRCDPTLPRCSPCERSGSTCEYFDTAKGKKINRYYVVKLQERVRALEADLGHFTDEEDFPKNNEDIIRPGGLVSLNESDETPRYLGPSSGIAMTRILMEEAKRFTDSKSISELIPGVRCRRPAASTAGGIMGNRSQSFSMPPRASVRKKSYPMVSAVPAQSLPTRDMADKLMEVFHQRAQIFSPTLHEKKLASTLEDVYNGSQDPYQNFIIRMVMAISMQKLDSMYAGLADSFYLAAMLYFEDVVRPKDLKSLQCLVLIGQYSLLTPTRTAVYYIIGLAVRICQQLGLADEKTISLGADDPLTLDMRRRLSWIVTTNEFGLAFSMGRPNGFAKSHDVVDVRFFETALDENITENGILPGSSDEKKLVAIQFCKMRICQSEIRRVLYENKQHEPKDDRHPWFANMEAKIEQWLNSSPESPVWCKPWFTGRYHTMVVALHRPSPQVPRPSVKSATKCFDSAAYVINISSKQMMAAAVDITWVFLLTLYMAVNTILWSISSYPAIRAAHSRDEVEELINISLDIIDQCTERWPGTAAASQLYSTFAKACLQSYDTRDTPMLSSPSIFDTPPSQPDTNSPSASDLSAATTISKTSAPAFNPTQFGYVFDSVPEPVNFDNPFRQPTFRSNSIFYNPSSSEPTARRFSYFPPDCIQSSENLLMEEATPPAEHTVSPPLASPLHPLASPNHLPTPPESAPPGSVATPATSFMPTPMLTTSNLPTPHITHSSPPPVTMPANTIPPQHRPAPTTFTVTSLPQQHQQRPLPAPTTVTDWFSPPPPFISPYAFGGMGGGFWGNSANGNGLGVAGLGEPQFTGLPPERQGSLSLAQQTELMNVLENEGMTDIDTYLNTINYGNDVMCTSQFNMNWTNGTNGHH